MSVPAHFSFHLCICQGKERAKNKRKNNFKCIVPEYVYKKLKDLK